MPEHIDNRRELQIKTQDLTLGMYVTRLDKPRPDTPFASEGMAVEAPEDIARLQSQCDHVYIDPERCDRYSFPLIPLTVEA